MQTLYIDVYFLINFTVDLLAIHFASAISRTRIGAARLVLSSLILSAIAVIYVFLPTEAIYRISLLALVTLVLLFFALKKVGFFRRVRFAAATYILMLIIGGAVNYLFGLLERYFPSAAYDGTVNRGILAISAMILICTFAIKIAVSLFSGVAAERSVKILIELAGKRVEVESFVDTGNLLKDPIDATPVMLLKKSVAEGLFDREIPEVSNLADAGISSRIRLIPIKRGNETEIKIGYRPERAHVVSGKREEEISIVFIVDEEEGTFGGYYGLVPASAVDGI